MKLEDSVRDLFSIPIKRVESANECRSRPLSADMKSKLKI